MVEEEYKFLLVGDDSLELRRRDFSQVIGFGNDFTVEFQLVDAENENSFNTATVDDQHQNYSAVIISFDITSQVSFEKALANLKSAMHYNDARLVDIPIVLVGLESSPNNDETRVMSSDESKMLAENLGTKGYYEVNPEFIIDILESPEDFANQSIEFAGMRAQEESLANDLLGFAKLTETQTKKIADSLIKPIHDLSKLKIPEISIVHTRNSESFHNMSRALRNNCSFAEFKDLQSECMELLNNSLDELDTIQRRHQVDVRAKSRSIFRAHDTMTGEIRKAKNLISSMQDYLEDLEETLKEAHDARENRPPSFSFQ